MLEAPESAEIATLPLAPKNPLPYRHQLRAVGSLIDGFQQLLDAGGPVTRIVLGPKWLFPTAVLIATPQGARDVLGRTDEIADRGGTTTTIQMYQLMGGNCPSAADLGPASATTSPCWKPPWHWPPSSARPGSNR
jgi:hypothetical protein